MSHPDGPNPFANPLFSFVPQTTELPPPEKAPEIIVPDPVLVDGLNRAWVVGPEEAFPPSLEEALFGKGTRVAPEKALVTIAPALPYEPAKPQRTPSLPPIAIERPDINSLEQILQHAPDEPERQKAWDNAKKIVDRAIEKISLARSEYVLGESAHVHPVTAVELKTPPVNEVTVFDPIYLQVELPGWEGVNVTMRSAAEIMTLAETINSVNVIILNPLSRLRLGRNPNDHPAVKNAIRRQIEFNPDRLLMMQVALRAQLVSGRFAIRRALREELPSQAVMLLAFGVDNFTTGGIGDIMGRNKVARISRAAAMAPTSLEEELRRVSALLERVNNYQDR